MNVIGFFVITGYILYSVDADPPQNKSKMEKFLYNKCRIHSADAATYDDIKKHLDQFSDYFTYAASLLPNGKEQFCNDEKPRLIGLARDLAKESKSCMHRDEKYLPKFLADSLTGFLNFVCSGRNVESFFSTQGTQCRQDLKQNQVGEEVGDCFRKFFVRFNDVIKKDDLCLDLKSAKKCFGEALARYCADFAAFESLNRKFFEAIMEPCNNSPATFAASSTILLIAAFVSSKFYS